MKHSRLVIRNTSGLPAFFILRAFRKYAIMWPFKKEKRGLESNPITESELMRIIDGGESSAAGRMVSAGSALQISAVYACVRVLALAVASLPLHVYRRRGDARELATGHYLYPVLHHKSNPEMTSAEFRECMQANLSLRGNAYAEIVYDGSGAIRELWPIPADRVSVARDYNTQKLVYTVVLLDGSMARLSQREIFHLREMGDGVSGYSPIRLFRECFGLTLAAEEFGGRFFSNSLRPSGVFEHPGKLSPTAAKNLKESIESSHQPLSKKMRYLLLEEGMKWQQLSINPEDAQFLQTRSFQVGDVCRIFDVPGVLVGYTDDKTNTYASVEQFFLQFAVYKLRPRLVKIEQAIKCRLMLDGIDDEYYPEFSLEGLLRGDSTSRAAFYRELFNIGVFSQNDIRRRENENPIPNGDRYYVPLNMIATDMVDKVAATQKPKQQRIEAAFDRLFRDAIARIVRRERADITRYLRTHGTNLNKELFGRWLDEFYAEHNEFIRRNIDPVYASYIEATNKQGEDVSASVESFVRRHTVEAKKRVCELVASGAAGEETITAMFDECEKRGMQLV